MTHPSPHPDCAAPHCTPDHQDHAHAAMPRKRIRLFHPRKLWVSLATVALTVGIAVGQFQYQSTHQNSQQNSKNDWLVATKINQDMQAFSLWGGAGKQGIEPFKFRVSLLKKDEVALAADLLKQHKNAEVRSGVKRVCFWEDEITEPEYKAEVVEVKISEEIEPGALFQTEVLIKNTGNVTWYSYESDCENKTVVNLGTVKTLDRASVFFTPAKEGEGTGWIGDNRVALLEDAVLPGDTATFSFQSKAPLTESLYREYFGLVAENVTWFEGFEVPVDIPVGNITEEDRSKVRFIKNLSLDTRSLMGERWLEADLSEQRLKFHVGDTIVYTMPISSGAPKTPTPLGTWNIFLKQELRIGGAAPHYRMPYFQMFTKQGAGLHELPYLATDNGVFWKEALNHIGVPVSHGCIRMLPGDAVLVYTFTEIGTRIEIHK